MLFALVRKRITLPGNAGLVINTKYEMRKDDLAVHNSSSVPKT